MWQHVFAALPKQKQCCCKNTVDSVNLPFEQPQIKLKIAQNMILADPTKQNLTPNMIFVDHTNQNLTPNIKFADHTNWNYKQHKSSLFNLFSKHQHRI